MSFAVIFDMDGTLVESMAPAWRAINRGLEKYGFQVPDHEVKLYAGRPFEQKVVTWKEKHGVDVDLKYLLPLYEKLEHEELARNPTNPPGLIKLLDQLRAHHIQMGVGTSTNPQRAKRTLDLFKLSSYFTTVVTMANVSNSKPHPEMFLKVAHDLRTDPSRCIVIEDARSGIQAGLAGGMKVIALHNPYLPADEAAKAHMQIDSFEELSYDVLARLIDQ